MNTPFKHKQVKELEYGFTPSGSFPNRKARRVHKQKNSYNKGFNKMFKYIQYLWCTKTNKLKAIYHYYTEFIPGIDK